MRNSQFADDFKDLVAANPRFVVLPEDVGRYLGAGEVLGGWPGNIVLGVGWMLVRFEYHGDHWLVERIVTGDPVDGDDGSDR